MNKRYTKKRSHLKKRIHSRKRNHLKKRIHSRKSYKKYNRKLNNGNFFSSTNNNISEAGIISINKTYKDPNIIHGLRNYLSKKNV
jgi:hypothetical protein